MSTGFSFGAKTTATPTFGTGSITFGTPATQPAQQFGFGNLASTTPNLFGTQTAPATSNLGFKPTGFGAPTTTTASTGFSLSTPGTGFSFGATTPSFGNPTSSAPATGLTFGAPTTSSGLSFGAPAASTGLTFGTPASTAAAPTLGFKPTTTTTGLSFGTPATTGLSFGTPASTGISFGTPASTGISFGAPAPSTGLTFGTPSLGFGTTTTGSTGLTFGTATTTTPGLSFGTTTSAPTLGLSFGTTATTAPTLSFGTTTTTSTGLSFGTSTAGFGLGGLTTSATSSLGLTTATTTTQQSVGLGGIASTQAKTGTSAIAQKELPPKEQLLPNEFLQCVEHFKNFVQQEKTRSTDVARCSDKEFHKVETELDSLNHQLNQMESQLMNNRSLAEQLKYDTAKGLQNIEMAQRTQDTPPSLQYENTAPLQYFLDLADSFEREMQLLKIKIDNTEKFIKKYNEPNVLTSQDLAVGLKRLHETFVALAGRMQAIHSQVETQKEVFLSLRKQAIKDNVNPFEKASKTMEAVQYIMRNAMKTIPANLDSGPTPFNNTYLSLGSNNVSFVGQQQQPPTYQTASTTTSSLGFGFGNSSSTFGMASSNNSFFKPLQPSSSFQLQKPPTGNKRGKQ